MCEAPWPCQAARDALTEEYQETTPALGILMAGYLAQACQDFGGQATPADLYDRFLSWVRHPLADMMPGG